MKRTFEWVLAGLGAIMCIVGAAFVWIPQAASNPPGISLWPMPALLLIEVALLGIAGFLGIAFEPQPLSACWGFLVWIACGGLIALSVIGAMSVSVMFCWLSPRWLLAGRLFWRTDAEGENCYLM